MTLHFVPPNSLRRVDGLTANFEGSYDGEVIRRGTTNPELGMQLDPPQTVPMSSMAPNPPELAALGSGGSSAMSRQLAPLSGAADPQRPGVREVDYATNNQMQILQGEQQNAVVDASYDKTQQQMFDDQARAINPQEQPANATSGQDFLEKVLRGALPL